MTGILVRTKNIIRANKNYRVDALQADQKKFMEAYELLKGKRAHYGGLRHKATMGFDNWSRKCAEAENFLNGKVLVEHMKWDKYGYDKRKVVSYQDIPKPPSETAIASVKSLLTQAEAYRDSFQKQVEHYAEIIKRIDEQIAKIENLVYRIKGIEYTKELHEGLQETMMGLDPSEKNKVNFFDTTEFQDLVREIKRTEYVNEALLELGKN